jgi:hypothetical protein
VPVGLILILRRHNRGGISRTRATAATASLAALFAALLTLTVNGLAFDSARWSAAQSLVRTGVSTLDIDAVLEWVGYHDPGPAMDARTAKRRAVLPWHAQTLFSRAAECYVLTSSPVGGLGRIMTIFDYCTYLAFGRSRLCCMTLASVPQSLPSRLRRIVSLRERSPLGTDRTRSEHRGFVIRLSPDRVTSRDRPTVQWRPEDTCLLERRGG